MAFRRECCFGRHLDGCPAYLEARTPWRIQVDDHCIPRYSPRQLRNQRDSAGAARDATQYGVGKLLLSNPCRVVGDVAALRVLRSQQMIVHSTLDLLAEARLSR